MVPAAGVAFIIHHPAIPFAQKCGHAVNAPVNENSEFRLFVPFGNRIFCKTFPFVFVFAVFNDFVNLQKIVVHLFFCHNYLHSNGNP